MTRPNILLIMSDEHDPAVLGCDGDPIDPAQATLPEVASHGRAWGCSEQEL